jgi:hypothetical protein
MFNNPRWATYVPAALLFILGAVFFLPRFVLLPAALDSRDWPSTPGTVKVSEYIPAVVGDDSPDAKIRYEYEVDGTAYSSSRVAFGRSSDSAYEFFESHPEGSSVTVYYDSAGPENAVLEPGTDGLWLDMIVGGSLIIGAVAWLARGIWQSREQQERS